MKLEDYVKAIEKSEGITINKVIEKTAETLNKSAFMLKDDFIEMLGVFWSPYLRFCIDNNNIDKTMVEDDIYPNYLDCNEYAINSGLDTNDDYAMVILGLYLALVTKEIDVANEIIVDGKYYNYSKIIKG